MYNASVAVNKKCNGDGGFLRMHKNYIYKYTNGEIYSKKAEVSKGCLRSC